MEKKVQSKERRNEKKIEEKGINQKKKEYPNKKNMEFFFIRIETIEEFRILSIFDRRVQKNMEQIRRIQKILEEVLESQIIPSEKQKKTNKQTLSKK